MSKSIKVSSSAPTTIYWVFTPQSGKKHVELSSWDINNRTRYTIRIPLVASETFSIYKNTPDAPCNDEDIPDCYTTQQTIAQDSPFIANLFSSDGSVPLSILINPSTNQLTLYNQKGDSLVSDQDAIPGISFVSLKPPEESNVAKTISFTTNHDSAKSAYEKTKTGSTTTWIILLIVAIVAIVIIAIIVIAIRNYNRSKLG